MIVIYDTLGAYGGSHTLMLRMAEWLHEKNIKLAIIGTSIRNYEIVNMLKSINTNVIEGDLSNSSKGYQIIKSLLEVEPIKVFCFSWNYYLDVERIKQRYRVSFDNFVYCIHPETFKKGIGFRTKLMRDYSIKKYRAILEKMNRNGSLISVDEVNIKESEKYLRCDLHGITPIVYLPMYCLEREDKEKIISEGYKSNIIMTAARADFPYKGYMVGLVDIFARLKKEYPEMQMEYVTAGDDIQQLKDKIEELPNEISSSIRIHAWMAYEDLKAFMRTCRVYIGMGTTVFDAALQYKPSIVVKFGTMECISDHFVAEKPTYMTALPSCVESAEGRIKNAFLWGIEEYHQQSMESFNKTKEVYDIDKCMKQLIRSETKDKRSILTNREAIRHSLNQRLNRIRFRNRRAYDFRDLEMDKEK